MGVDWAAIGFFAGLQQIEHELLLFALFWFLVGMLDELAVDGAWSWLRLTGRVRTGRAAPRDGAAPLQGMHAVFIPAWQEADVIGATIRHMLAAWPHRELRLYIGIYRNDPATLAAAALAAGADPRVRLVVHDCAGPSTKADCLNRLHAALLDDEARSGGRFRAVVLHDAEDMVHPCALAEIDRALDSVDFVQLPVRPELQPGSRWIAGHYADEFTEAHAKAMTVRDALGAGLPAAGVGCGFAREALAALVGMRQQAGGGAAAGRTGPFAAECLTEDYELGLLIARAGGRSRFLRLRDEHGDLVATRSYFPDTITAAVRQKTRWVHGIAFQGWERLGWSGRMVDIWMALRDRRGPLTALVLAVAYLLLLVEAVLLLAALAGWHHPPPVPQDIALLLKITLAGFVWRAAMRFAFTAREYGLAEGARAVLRIPLANVVAIMAGRRALLAYLRTLRGAAVTWDKTTHLIHPAIPAARQPA